MLVELIQRRGPGFQPGPGDPEDLAHGNPDAAAVQRIGGRGVEDHGVEIDEYPALKKWRDAILDRPAVQKAVQVLADRRRPPNEMSKEQKENLFGAAQYAKR